MVKEPLIVLVIILGIVFVPHSYGQDSYVNKPVQIIRGQISHIDWVRSNIAVKWLQPDGVNVYDEITFFVPKEANITRNGENIALSDVQIGDNTKVEYVKADLVGLRALNISIVK